MKLFAVVLGATLVAYAGSAVSETDPIRTEPIVVTATRLDDLSRSPARVTIVTAEEIARSPAKSLPEFLGLQAGVTARSLYGNYGVRDSVDMRGFGATAGQNTLILLDGRRLNDVDLAAVDFPTVPLESIERIEISHGNGAVLYGDGAVGGTINVITKGPGRAGTRGAVGLTGASYGTAGLTATASYTQGVFGASLFVNRLTSDGYRENNDLDQTNALVDMRWTETAREWFVKLGADDQKLRLPGPRRVEPGAGIDQLTTDRRGTSTPNDFANQTGGQFTAGVLLSINSNTRLTIDGGIRRKHQESFFESSFSALDTELSTASLTPRLAADHQLFGLSTHSVVGVDYYRSDYDSDRAQSTATIGTPIHRLAIDQDSLAFYFQTTTDITDRTHLTIGARRQRVDLDATDQFDPTAPGATFESGAVPFSQRNSESSYEVGVRQRFRNGLSFFARTERSARFATVDELFEFDPVSFVRVFSPLEPETARGITVGGDFRLRDTTLAVSAYRMRLQNEISFNPITFTNDNLDPTRRSGILVTAGQRLTESLRTQIDYTYTRAKFREGTFAGNDVPLVPQHSAALSLLWDPIEKSTLATVVRYTGGKRFDNDQSNTFSKIPGYTMVDLKYSTRGDTWEWQATVNNLFDRKAFDYGIRSTFTPDTFNAFPLPERNYSVTVNRRF